MSNTNLVKVTGRVEIPSGLELGTEYGLAIVGAECRKIEEVPNDDGTNTKIFNLKLSGMSEMNILSKKETIKSSKKGSQSQMQRAVILRIADKLGVDREEYYSKRMSNNIAALERELLENV